MLGRIIISVHNINIKHEIGIIYYFTPKRIECMGAAEMDTVIDTEWLTRKQAALYLRQLGCPLSPQTLANMAKHENSGQGPPFTRIGVQIVRYNKDDLAAWAARKAVRIS